MITTGAIQERMNNPGEIVAKDGVKKPLIILIYVFSGIILFLIAAFRLLGVDVDYSEYTKLAAGPEFRTGAEEIAFRFILWVNDVIRGSDPKSFFIIFAAIGVPLKLIALFRRSRIPMLSLLMYISSYYLLHEYVQIRASIAIGFFLLAIDDISSGDIKKYSLKASMAVIFHWSSIILFPLYFIVKYKDWRYFLGLPFFGLLIQIMVFDFNFLIIKILSPVEVLSVIYKLHAGHSEGVRVFNLISSTQLIIFLILGIGVYWQERRGKLKNNVVIMYKIFSVSIFLFYLFSAAQLPVIAFRLNEYLSSVLFLLIPALLDAYKQKVIMAIGFIGYFLAYGIHLLFSVKIIPGLFG